VDAGFEGGSCGFVPEGSASSVSVFVVEWKEVIVKFVEFIDEFVPFLLEGKVRCGGVIIVVDVEIDGCCGWKIGILGRIIA